MPARLEPQCESFPLKAQVIIGWALVTSLALVTGCSSSFFSKKDHYTIFFNELQCYWGKGVSPIFSIFSNKKNEIEYTSSNICDRSISLPDSLLSDALSNIKWRAFPSVPEGLAPCFNNWCTNGILTWQKMKKEFIFNAPVKQRATSVQIHWTSKTLSEYRMGTILLWW